MAVKQQSKEQSGPVQQGAEGLAAQISRIEDYIMPSRMPGGVNYDHVRQVAADVVRLAGQFSRQHPDLLPDTIRDPAHPSDVDLLRLAGVQVSFTIASWLGNPFMGYQRPAGVTDDELRAARILINEMIRLRGGEPVPETARRDDAMHSTPRRA